MRTAAGDQSPVKGIGSAILQCYNGLKWSPLSLDGILYVPGLEHNLLSGDGFTSNGYRISLEHKVCKIVRCKDDYTVAIGTRNNRLWKLKYQVPLATVNMISHGGASVETWHRRLGHPDWGSWYKVPRGWESVGDKCADGDECGGGVVGVAILEIGLPNWFHQIIESFSTQLLDFGL